MNQDQKNSNRKPQSDFNRNAKLSVDSTVAPVEPTERGSTRIDSDNSHAPSDRRDRESKVPDAELNGD